MNTVKGRGIGCKDMMSYSEEQTEKMSKEEKKHYGDYDGKCQAEGDLHTLIEARSIKKDEERYERAMYYADEKRKEMECFSMGKECDDKEEMEDEE